MTNSLPRPTGNDRLRELDRSVVWHAFSQMSDYDGLIIESAQGCWLTDIDGRRILDGASSMWCNLHGHRNPHIDDAIRRQLNQVAHVTNLGMSHSTTIELAARLTQLAPSGLNHVFFAGDGASAVEAAMKIAFQYWRQCENPQPARTKFLALGSAYHGDTLGAVSVGGVSQFHSLFQPLLFPVVRGPLPDTYRLPAHVDLEGAAAFYLEQYRSLFEQLAHELVAAIVEPMVQGAAGMIIHPPGFLSGLSDLCREFNCLLIADEVAVGLGRTGMLFACEHESVVPDILCIGKGLTGGYLPMSATLVTDRVWRAFLGGYEESRSFLHGHTYGGNPLCAAAAMATLDLFVSNRTLETLTEKASYLSERLRSLRDHPMVGDVRQLGLMAAIELVADKRTKLAFPWQERRAAHVCKRILESNVWLRPLGNVIPIIPPLAIEIEELDFLVRAIESGLDP
ncbi:MAG: adenosylmethionine--8-amino-7-oxononanoate transaminase [Pirellula sp.]